MERRLEEWAEQRKYLFCPLQTKGRKGGGERSRHGKQIEEHLSNKQHLL